MLLGLTVFTWADTWKKPTFWYMGVVNQYHKGSQKVGKGTATLISPQWALTAKHVAQFKISQPNGGAMEIVFGSGERAYVTKAYPAPGEDIALCRLNRRINSIEKTALMTGCWAAADGLVTFTHVGKSGGLHWKRNVKGRGSCHGFDIKNGNPGKAGDSGGFFGFERSGCQNVQFSVIHGGGNGPQVGPLKAWITNTINTHGGDQPEWVTKSEVRNGMPGSNHTWSGGGASKKWNDYNNWSTCGKPGVSGNSNTANSEIAQLAYKANTAKYQPEPQLENNWSIGKIVFKKSTHHDLTVRDDSSWNVNNGSSRRLITLNGNGGEGIRVEDDVQGSYVYDFEQGIRILMANDLDWRIDGDETLLLRGRLSGSGKLTKQGTGTLKFVDRNGQCTNNGSTDLDLLLGTVVLNKTANSTTIGGDILINGPGATLRLDNREQIGDNATVTVQSGLFNQNNWHETIGTLSLRGGAMISGSLTGTADIDARSGVVFSDLLGTAGLNKTTTGTVSLYGSSSYSGDSTISKGELRIMGSHEHAGDYAVNGGTLSGNGTIDGPTMVAAGGTLSPGAGGIGNLGIHNDVSLEGITRMEINGDTLAADQVTGIATIHYGGTLELVLNGGTLDEYDGFILFDAQSYTGAFTTLNFPAIPSNLVWRTETLHEDGSISIGDPAKPLVSNTGISVLTVTNATLNGTLVSTGATPTSVSVFWGPSDGGTETAAWSNRVDLGQEPIGSLSVTASPLLHETTYYYRFFASNSGGDTWATGSLSFTTPSGGPRIINRAAESMTPTSAVARAELQVEGAGGNAGFLFWGEVDAGEDPGAWEHALALGPLAVGEVHTPITGLAPDSTYYYRFLVTNSFGSSLASPSIPFATTGLEPLAFDYRMQICFDGYDRPSPLTNFPWLVALDESLPGFKYETVHSAIAADLRFTTLESINTLPYEIESWDTNGTSYVWVKVPLLDSNACIFAYWGNPEAESPPAYTTDGSTWSEGFGGVWHLDHALGTGLFPDSGPGGFHGTNDGTASVPGKIGGGRNWNGSDIMYLPPEACAGISNAVTLSIWQYGDPAKQPQKDFLFSASSPVGKEFAAKTPDEGGRIEWDAFGNYDRISKTAATAEFEGQWNHWTFTKDSDAPSQRIYLNGELFHSDAGTSRLYTAVNTLVLGAQDDDQYHYDGYLDEFRVSHVERSEDWIWAASQNMSGAGVLDSYRQVRGLKLPTIVETGVSNITPIRAELNGFLVSTGISPTAVSVYWGSSDGGFDPAAWDQGRNLGLSSEGALSMLATDLRPDQSYVYRYFASNSVGHSWSETAESFLTPASQLDPELFAYRMPIGLDGYARAETLGNFPLLVVFDPSLINFHYSTFASSEGFDLRFTASDGSTLLNYEVERWDTTGSSYIWVQVPTLNSNESIVAYWGNPGASLIAPPYTGDGSTWSEGFGGVWHLDHALDTGLFPDSGPGGFHATDDGTAGIEGKIGGGRNWNGSDIMYLPPEACAGISNAVTLSIWQYGDPAKQPQKDFLFSASSPVGKEFAAKTPDEGGRIEWDAFGNYDRISKTAATAEFEGQWNHWTFTKNSDAPSQRIYLNGELFHSEASTSRLYTAVNTLVLGAQDDDQYHYDGYLDEFRVSHVERSEDWIWAASQNMSGALPGYGPAERLRVPTVTTENFTGLGPSTVTLHGALVSTGSAPSSAWVYWGTADGESDANAWAHAAGFGTSSPGPLSISINNLPDDRNFFYRFRSTNSEGEAWALTTGTFTTPYSPVLATNDYTHRLKIRFDGYSGQDTLTNFPALVVLDESITDFFFEGFASETGGDLRFTDADGITVLNYEIEDWDPLGSSFAWVKVPEMTSTACVYAYWGKSQATNHPSYSLDGSTWSGDHLLVMHMNKLDAAEQLPDSSPGFHHGEHTGTDPVSGMIAGGRDWEGSDYIRVPRAAVSPLSGKVTISLWQYGDAAIQPQNDTLFRAENSSGVRELSAHLPWGGDKIYWDAGAGSSAYDRLTKSGASATDYKGQWNHWAFTKDLDSGKMRMVLNGSGYKSATGYTRWMGGITTDFFIGSNVGGSGSYYDGILDEFRISKVVRSDDWIEAEYKNGGNHVDFQTYEPVDYFNADSDVDLLPDNWELANFGTLTASDGTGDLDNDGRTDLEEYISDTDPTDIESHLWMLISRLDEPEHLLVFPTSHRRVYWIESAPGLDIPFTPASPVFAGDGGLMTMDLPHPAEPRVYYRIVATLP